MHKMRFAAAIFAILAVTGPLNAYELPATGSGDLAKHLQDIVDLVPLDKMVQLTRTYYQKDKDFKLLMSYMKSSESKLLVQDIEAAPVMQELAHYMQNNGLDIYKLVNKLNAALDLAPVVPQDVSDQEIVGGIDGYILEMSKLATIKDFKGLLDDKVKNSKSFADYVEFCTQRKFAEFYVSVYSNVHFVALRQQATEAGLNAQYINNYYFVYLIAAVVVA